LDATAVISRQGVVHLRWKLWLVLAFVLAAASVAGREWHESSGGVSTTERLSSAIALPFSPSEVPEGFDVRMRMPVPGSSLSGAVEGYAITLLGPGAQNRITYLRFGTAAEAKAHVAGVRGEPAGGELGGRAICIKAKGQCLAAFGPVVVTGSSHLQCYGSVDAAALERARTLLRAGAVHLRNAA
jgi:hypothetical protein